MTCRPATSLLAIALGLASCAPKAEPAVAPAVAASAWQGSAPQGAMPLSGAWGAFGSAELESLIARARAANADIAVAAARVVQARGALGVARAESRPTVSGSGAAGLSADASGLRGGGRADQSLGVDIAYDVDLFGSARAGKRAARARLAASGYERDAVALAVESEVARAFVQHAGLTERLRLLERALGNARELDRIIGVRVREGAATKVDSGLQRIEVRRIEAELSRIREARARTRNALATLVGTEAPSFSMGEPRLDDLRVPTFEVVQPGALLARRPDVRAAEARIAAANGDVARARAAFLPSLRLSAGSLLGASGGPLGTAISAGSGLLAPIFSGGRLQGGLLSARGAQTESVEAYRKALLTALGETEDALAGMDQARERGVLLGETLAVARTTARLARRQYVEGAADLQTVLNAERGLLDIEEAGAAATQDRLGAAIDLYRAMGGAPRVG